MHPLQLLLPLISWSVTVNGQLSDLFLSITVGDYLTVDQCGNVTFEFGGGMPPYFIEVLSYYGNQLQSSASVDSSGTILWTVNYAPNLMLYLYVNDSLGSSQVSHYFDVVASRKVCNFAPKFRWDSHGTLSSIISSTEIPAFSTSSSTTSLAMTSTGPPPSTQLSISSNNTAPSGETSTGTPPSTPTFSTTTAPPTVVPSAAAGLDDCLSKKASCTFISTSTGSDYPQQTQIGSSFDNCGSEIPVWHTWSGSESVNITNNWSVSGSLGLSLPKALGNVKFSGSKGGSEEITLSQTDTYSYEATPHIRVALVGTAWLNVTFGSMTIKNSGKSENHFVALTLKNVVYFQINPNVIPDVSARTFNCNETWPILWNATTAVPIDFFIYFRRTLVNQKAFFGLPTLMDFDSHGALVGAPPDPPFRQVAPVVGLATARVFQTSDSLTALSEPTSALSSAEADDQSTTVVANGYRRSTGFAVAEHLPRVGSLCRELGLILAVVFIALRLFLQELKG
ncbi:hypothetical protein B0H14DRAFT_2570124 [Mycena olivaceomarginata]|nr:hypothetical protein B0H14DRAFT_2570124 [Mycena olivaceomarginata]